MIDLSRAAPAAKAAAGTDSGAAPRTTGRDRRIGGPTCPTTNRRNPPPADTDPARTLVERIRARDQTLPGGVSRADGWLSINQEAVRAWARDSGVQPYVLIRTLGHLPGCRVTPDGGLAVREES